MKSAKYPILDDVEVPEQMLENWQITADLLAQFANIPAALIMRVHAHEIEVAVSSHSVGNVYHHGEKAPLDTGLYCETVMSTQQQLLVPNALKDTDWDSNPDVALGMISYCGLPLLWPNNSIFGTICILDTQENRYSPQVINLMERLRDSIQFNLNSLYESTLSQLKLGAAENALSESEARFRMIVEGVKDCAILMLDGTGHIVSWNEGAERIYGYHADEIIGQSYSRFFFEEDIKSGKLQRELEIAAAEGNIEDEGWRVRKDGARFIANEVTTALSDRTGILRGFAKITRDVTQRKQEEAELIRQRNQLEVERIQLTQRIAERTSQLQRANHAKDSFLATMSHEIRTPLAGLLGMMELLDLSQLNLEQRELLKTARASGNGLLRIVNDILDWSKIEAGKLELAPVWENFASMFKSVTDTYAQIAAEKNLQFKVEIAPELTHNYLFDYLRLSQILNNFTSNALKFAEQGNITLSAQLIGQHDGIDTIRFSVQDYGIGIAPEPLQRLFKQYEQASAETARIYGGTGLGLAICSRLAELMGGTLAVESRLGVGSTFSITLNLRVATQSEQEKFKRRHTDKNDTIPVMQPLRQDGKQSRILIVDDHPLNRKLLKQQLETLDVQVEVATDGNEAISKFQTHSYDLIISDCHMPGMDGYELTRRIRNIEFSACSARIPIIAWTANVLAKEVEQCYAAGMDDLITKPTELATLRNVLSKWLVIDATL